MDQLLFYWHRVCECPSCSITVHRAVTATPNRSLIPAMKSGPLLLALARSRRPTVSFMSACRLPVALPRGVLVAALVFSGPGAGFVAGLLVGTDLLRP